MSNSMKLLMKEGKDATECLICTDIFSSPKILPCFHTFCLKCIEQYGKDTREGGTLTCPLCRREFKVPVGGFSELKSNFFLERLVATVNSVSMCMECQQSICGQYSNVHGSMRTHHFSPIQNVLSIEVMKKAFCETHPKKEVEFYCQGCRVFICEACSITKHSKHDICDIAVIAEESKELYQIYANGASSLMMNIKKRSGEFSEQLDSLTDSIAQVKTSIIRRGEDIKRMVDKRTNDLLVELNYHKALVSKTVEDKRDDLERNLLICNSFKQFCAKIIAKADHVESVSVADELATRAADLNMLSIPELETCSRLKFIPSDFDTTGYQKNIVGNLFGEC